MAVRRLLRLGDSRDSAGCFLCVVHLLRARPERLVRANPRGDWLEGVGGGRRLHHRQLRGVGPHCRGGQGDGPLRHAHRYGPLRDGAGGRDGRLGAHADPVADVDILRGGARLRHRGRSVGDDGRHRQLVRPQAGEGDVLRRVRASVRPGAGPPCGPANHRAAELALGLRTPRNLRHPAHHRSGARVPAAATRGLRDAPRRGRAGRRPSGRARRRVPRVCVDRNPGPEDDGLLARPPDHVGDVLRPDGHEPSRRPPTSSRAG